MYINISYIIYRYIAKTTHLVQGSFQEASGLGALASVSWSGRHVVPVTASLGGAGCGTKAAIAITLGQYMG